MPHAQKLHEKYKDNPDIIILVVSTAFEKSRYPWMADEKKIKANLEKNGWTMPVARDKDEQCINKVFGIGTSSALVIDPSGVIQYHAANSRDGKKIDKMLEEQLAALQDVTVPAPYDVDECLSSVVGLIKGGKYAEALKQAELVAATEEENLKKAQKSNEDAENFADRDPAASAKIVREARYLMSLINNSAKRHAQRAEKLSTYDPPAAIELAKKMSSAFKGIAAGDALGPKAQAWGVSPEYKAFIALEAEFKKAAEKYDNDSAKALEMMKSIAERGKGTRIGDDAQKICDEH